MLKWLSTRIGFSRIAGLVLLAFLVLLRVNDPVPVERLRLQVFDVYQQIRNATVEDEALQSPVAIIDIDDESLAEIGQWPWPRTTFAALTRRAMQAGAAVVAFDIVFAEPDRLSPNMMAADHPTLPDRIRLVLELLPSNDVLLAEAFRASRVVVGQTSTRQSELRPGAQSGVLQVPYAIRGPDPSGSIPSYPELIENLPQLEAAATGRAVFTVKPDPDGIYRRVPSVVRAAGEYRLSLPLEALRVATGGNAFLIRSNDQGLEGIGLKGIQVRTELDGTIWNNFTPSSPARFISAADLLNDRVPRERLAGKILFVGTSAIGLEDFRATPLGVPMPGVEIHAQILENILTDRLLKRPAETTGMELSAIVLLPLLLILLAPRLSASAMIGGTLVLALGFAGLSYFMFLEHRLLVDPTFPVLAIILTAMLLSSVKYINEELQRRQIRNAFGQYVSPELVTELADNPEKLALGGERRELTIMFMDVRGFTAISETFRDDPGGLTRLMNRFLTLLSEEILATGGTIDKYMGDAIMAFWNAPTEEPAHARQASTAALAMLRAIDRFNTSDRRENETGWPQIDIGIGLNTGSCTVGNMGSDRRFDYSALGDPVNLASRLEGQTKSYGVSIIIGNETHAAIAEAFATLELDLIRVKGKQVAERIHALVGDATRRGSSRFADLAKANDRMLNLYRNADWDSAETALAELSEMAPDAGVDLTEYVRLYADRINTYRADPPPENWDGVFEATSK